MPLDLIILLVPNAYSLFLVLTVDLKGKYVMDSVPEINFRGTDQPTYLKNMIVWNYDLYDVQIAVYIALINTVILGLNNDNSGLVLIVFGLAIVVFSLTNFLRARWRSMNPFDSVIKLGGKKRVFVHIKRKTAIKIISSISIIVPTVLFIFWNPPHQ